MKKTALLLSIFTFTLTLSGCAAIDNGIRTARTINPEICGGLETQTVQEVKERLGDPSGYRKIDENTVVRTYQKGYFIGMITFKNDRVVDADCRTESKKEFKVF